MRLDKLLANTGDFGSRKDVKKLLRKKSVVLNGKCITDGSVHVQPESDKIEVSGKAIQYQPYIYLLLNKPSGYISATEDNREKTVIDLLDGKSKNYQPFPVGRLDKDTEGLLLLTNDGQLAHRLLSPKGNIAKTYFARIDGFVTKDDAEKFANGVVLDDGYLTKPAELSIIKQGDLSEVHVTIREGKFHQVKRMFEAVGKKVIYLQRLSMGEIVLDKQLPLGAYRPLNEQEMAYCETLRTKNKN